ncbi:hypothetical protein Csa_023836, partial [Cucumis sativus]
SRQTLHPSRRRVPMEFFNKLFWVNVVLLSCLVD